MSQEPIDFEAERRRAAKELGLPYTDLDDPVHWQRNMQTQEAKKELAEMLSKNDTKTQSREPLEDESTYASSDSIYTQGRTAQEEPEHTAGVAMNREHTKLSWKLRAESFVNKVKSFAASRRERSQVGGVAAQQKEKSRQIQTAAVGLTTVAAVVAGTMMLAGDDRGVRTEPVRVYKSDFRLEPEALDKQSYQKMYDEKLAGVTERLQTMEELAARLQKELAAQQEKKGTQSAASEPNTAVPVNQLPDFSPQSRAAIEAGTLSGAMNTSPPATFDGPRLKRLAVTDPIKDFEPVTLIAHVPNVLVVTPEFQQRTGIKSVKDLIAYCKANPDKLNYASGGNGSAGHMAGELLKAKAGIKMVHVPYAGASAAQLSVLAGQTDLIFDNLSSASANIQAGKLVPLAVTTTKRAEALPNVPTMVEAGVAGFDISTWYGLFVPAKTPRDIVMHLNTVITKALASDDMKKRLARLGGESAPCKPEEFAALIKTELAKYAEIVKASGARVD